MPVTLDGESGVNAIAGTIQPDGKVILVGEVHNGVAVIRLDTDGSLDTSFAEPGRGAVSKASPRPTSPS